MVYEMSHDEEISAFFELLGNDTQVCVTFRCFLPFRTVSCRVAACYACPRTRAPAPSGILMSTCVSHLTHDTWSLLFRRNNHEQLPGAFLFLGMILFCVPMATYMVSNVTMGIERGTPSADGWKLFTTEMKVQLAMSYGLVVITGIMLLYGFFYQLPALISCVPLCRRPSAPVY